MKIVPYHDDWKPAWDTFVFVNSDASLFQSTAWKRALERAFGFESRYVCAEEYGQIRGILPLFLSSKVIQCCTLISTPFAVYGGICSSDSAASFELRQLACATKEGVDYLELREPYKPFGDGFLTKELYVTFEQQLTGDPEKLMRGSCTSSISAEAGWENVPTSSSLRGL